MVKNCDLGIENAALGQDLSHSFSPYGPPSRQITYICIYYRHTRMQTHEYTYGKSSEGFKYWSVDIGCALMNLKEFMWAQDNVCLSALYRKE